METKTTTFDTLQQTQIDNSMVPEDSNQEDNTTLAITSDSIKQFEQQDDCKMEVEEGTLIAPDIFCPVDVLDWNKKSSRVSIVEEDDESMFDNMVCDASAKLIPKGFVKSNCTG